MHKKLITRLLIMAALTVQALWIAVPLWAQEQPVSVLNYSPRWSLDGKRIIFASREQEGTPDSASKIYVMNADGTHRSLLASDKCCYYDLAWSPAGKQIMFDLIPDQASGQQLSSQLFMMNADGTNRINILSIQAVASSLGWSPDGKQIAFVSELNGKRQIYIARADGTHPTNLSGSADTDNDPAWSPDGKQIAF
jgi:TolB protein